MIPIIIIPAKWQGLVIIARVLQILTDLWTGQVPWWEGSFWIFTLGYKPCREAPKTSAIATVCF